VEEKDKVMELLEEKYKEGAKKVSKLDGLKMEFEDWWFSVRKSNTEPLLRLVLEAVSKDLGQEKISEISQVVEKLA